MARIEANEWIPDDFEQSLPERDWLRAWHTRGNWGNLEARHYFMRVATMQSYVSPRLARRILVWLVDDIVELSRTRVYGNNVVYVLQTAQSGIDRGEYLYFCRSLKLILDVLRRGGKGLYF